MAKYTFKCIQTDCEKFNLEFMTYFPMADIGKTELYPTCECCGQITEKLFIATGAFALKGGNWFRNGYGTTDAGGRPIGNLVPLGTALKNSSASK